MNTKDKWETTITIHDEVRAAIWGEIFPGAVVPVRSIVPVRADLPGHPGARVYFLDLEAVEDGQLDQLVRKMAELFSLNPDEVRQDMMEKGVPILADNTSVQSTDPDIQARIESLTDLDVAPLAFELWGLPADDAGRDDDGGDDRDLGRDGDGGDDRDLGRDGDGGDDD